MWSHDLGLLHHINEFFLLVCFSSFRLESHPEGSALSIYFQLLQFWGKCICILEKDILKISFIISLPLFGH